MVSNKIQCDPTPIGARPQGKRMMLDYLNSALSIIRRCVSDGSLFNEPRKNAGEIQTSACHVIECTEIGIVEVAALRETVPVHRPVTAALIATKGAVISLATVDITDGFRVGDVLHDCFLLCRLYCPRVFPLSGYSLPWSKRCSFFRFQAELFLLVCI